MDTGRETCYKGNVNYFYSEIIVVITTNESYRRKGAIKTLNNEY